MPDQVIFISAFRFWSRKIYLYTSYSVNSTIYRTYYWFTKHMLDIIRVGIDSSGVEILTLKLSIIGSPSTESCLLSIYRMLLLVKFCHDIFRVVSSYSCNKLLGTNLQNWWSVCCPFGGSACLED